MNTFDAEKTASLKRAVEAFGEAWATGDIAELESMLSLSYTHNDVFGDHLKHDEWLAYASKRTGRGTRITFRDVEIRIFGDVGLVTGFNDMLGGGATSPTDTSDLSIAFTQVWVRRDGRWLREAFQATEVTPKTAT